MMRRNSVILGALLSAGILSSPIAHSDSLNHAVEHTIATNPLVLQTVKSSLASKQALNGAKGAFLPSIDLDGGLGWERSKNSSTLAPPTPGTANLERQELGLTATQLLIDGLGTYHEVQRNKAIVHSRGYGVANSANDTALQVAEVYTNVLRTSELVNAARANVAAHKRIFDMIKKRSAKGISKKVERVQAAGRLALARASLASALGNLREAKVQYVRVTGMQPSNMMLPSVPAKALPKDENSAIAFAVSNHPELKLANADVDAANAQHQTAKDVFYPRVDLVVSLRNDKNVDGVTGPDQEQYVMARAHWNIFRGGSDFARVRETAFLKQEAAEVRNNTHREVIENMHLAWVALNVNRNLVVYNRRHKEATGATVNAYQKQFTLGQRTLLDLLDTNREFFASSQNLINSRYDELLSKYRVLNGMNRLLAQLDVASPVEAIDNGVDA